MTLTEAVNLVLSGVGVAPIGSADEVDFKLGCSLRGAEDKPS
jgi:hypothetical protein